MTYLVSHPIQYQAPLLRRIAAEPNIDLRVVFERVSPEHRYFDDGFQREIQWDIALTEGYDFTALNDTDLSQEIAACDVLWLHGWQSPTMRQAIRMASDMKKKILMRGENCDLAMPDGRWLRGWLKRRYLGRIFGRCSGFLAIGSLNREYYLKRGVDAARIFPMPYAVDNDAFRDAAQMARVTRPDLRERLGIGASAPVVLYAGKLSRRKRADLLIRAMRKLDDLSPPPVLVLAGDGELMGKLRSTAPDAHFPGFVNQSELPAYYDMADAFVLPSECEPWGLAVNEAMACGTAVVVSDQVGSAPDLVDASNGAVFNAGDVQGLANALRHVLANAGPMGRAASDKIGSWNFDADISGLKAALGQLEVRP